LYLYVAQVKQQKNKKMILLINVSAHLLYGDVLLSNITFVIFAVLVVRRSCCLPYMPFQTATASFCVLNLRTKF